MQINRILSFPLSFEGTMKVENLKNGTNKEIQTTVELDKGLSSSALVNLFSGNWNNDGYKYINRKNLNLYLRHVTQTLGIKFPKLKNEVRDIELKRIENGYILKVGEEYKLTHIREDHLVYDA